MSVIFLIWNFVQKNTKNKGNKTQIIVQAEYRVLGTQDKILLFQIKKKSPPTEFNFSISSHELIFVNESL